MRRLVLIRHSESQPTPELPPRQWPLTPSGRRRCRPLAEQLAAFDPPIILSSKEQKAIETAQLVGSILGKPHRVVDGLGEHDRTDEPYHPRTVFLQLVKTVLMHPGKVVFGKESGAEALTRFEEAIARIVADQPEGNVAAVVHGTVLSLFVAAHSAEAAYPFWKQLGQPAVVVFSLPDMAFLNVTFEIS